MKKKKKVEGQEEQEVIEYIGDGAYLPGVPARDLTEKEWNHHKRAILASPNATQLYDIPEDELPKKPVEGEAAQESNGNG